MAINPIGGKIPLPPVSFLDPDGGINREWLYLLISLLNRTGGEVGISTSTIQVDLSVIQAQIAVLQALTATQQQQIVALFVEGAMNATWAQPQPINPFLAAMVVA